MNALHLLNDFHSDVRNGEFDITIEYEVKNGGSEIAPEGFRDEEETWDIYRLYINGEKFGETPYRHSVFEKRIGNMGEGKCSTLDWRKCVWNDR